MTVPARRSVTAAMTAALAFLAAAALGLWHMIRADNGVAALDATGSPAALSPSLAPPI
jgi:hypothetical protein